MRLSSGLRTVALFEATKGVLVLLVGFGALSLDHHNVQQLAERLIFHAHLNPVARFPRIFIEAAGRMTDARLLLMAAGAAAYSLLRFVEAYGLWHARRWGEWLAALSSGFYIPIELLELYERASWVSLGALLLNAAIVAFMLYCVFHADGGRSRAAV